MLPSYEIFVLLAYADPLDCLIAEDDGEAEADGLNQSRRQPFA